MKIYYDDEADFLEIMIGDSNTNYREDITDDIVLFIDEGTEELVGIGILYFKKSSNDLQQINIELPVEIGLSLTLAKIRG